jgi:hypothetical protein
MPTKSIFRIAAQDVMGFEKGAQNAVRGTLSVARKAASNVTKAALDSGKKKTRKPKAKKPKAKKAKGKK